MIKLGKLPMWWLLLSLGMILVWMLTPTIVEIFYRKTPEAGSGAFGDTFGFITSGFSVLTTMLIVAGLIFQREEIQKLEDALKQQGEEFETQNALTRQQMEFQEIQARIDAIPHLSSKIVRQQTPPHKVPYGEDDRPRWCLLVKNAGADIYDLYLETPRVLVGAHRRPSLRKDESWTVFLNFVDLQPSLNEEKARLTFITRYIEKSDVAFVAERYENEVGSFFDEAKKVREDVSKRFSAICSKRA